MQRPAYSSLPIHIDKGTTKTPSVAGKAVYLKHHFMELLHVLGWERECRRA